MKLYPNFYSMLTSSDPAVRAAALALRAANLTRHQYDARIATLLRKLALAAK